jgi:hypothetical protein
MEMEFKLCIQAMQQRLVPESHAGVLYMEERAAFSA